MLLQPKSYAFAIYWLSNRYNRAVWLPNIIGKIGQKCLLFTRVESSIAAIYLDIFLLHYLDGEA